VRPRTWPRRTTHQEARGGKRRSPRRRNRPSLCRQTPLDAVRSTATLYAILMCLPAASIKRGRHRYLATCHGDSVHAAGALISNFSVSSALIRPWQCAICCGIYYLAESHGTVVGTKLKRLLPEMKEANRTATFAGKRWLDPLEVADWKQHFLALLAE